MVRPTLQPGNKGQPVQRCQQILCASIRYRPDEKTESVSRSAAQKRPFRVAFHGLSARRLPEFQSFVIVPRQARGRTILALPGPSAEKKVRVSRSLELEESILFAGVNLLPEWTQLSRLRLNTRRLGLVKFEFRSTRFNDSCASLITFSRRPPSILYFSSYWIANKLKWSPLRRTKSIPGRSLNPVDSKRG